MDISHVLEQADTERFESYLHDLERLSKKHGLGFLLGPNGVSIYFRDTIGDKEIQGYLMLLNSLHITPEGGSEYESIRVLHKE